MSKEHLRSRANGVRIAMENETTVSRKGKVSLDVEANIVKEDEKLIDGSKKSEIDGKITEQKHNGISSTGLKVLVLLAVQNTSKNLLMRYVMKEKPKFLVSAAVIIVELTKLILSALYIKFVDKQPLSSIWNFLKEDSRNTRLLTIPAASYCVQGNLEYIAFANIDASVFAVLVQTKMLTAGLFFYIILGKRLAKKQVISLVILTTGVMLCNMKYNDNESEDNEKVQNDKMKGIIATLGEMTLLIYSTVRDFFIFLPKP